jgi:glycosyltransferase involved in cell wall biosynthesis
LIPDLMGLTSKSVSKETRLIDFVDFYMVTSKELYSLYALRFPKKPPSGLYRDLPNLALINSLKNEGPSARKQRVIWVGNSKWGAHQGAVDHKGKNEVVLPLRDELRQKVDFKIIDSSEKRLSHETVLREIRDSLVLIQTSKTEGTGLPLLEAAGLGTVTITTDVGVASDFLQGELQILIVERSIEGFLEQIAFAFSNSAQLSKMLEERFEIYVEEVSRDSIPQPRDTKLKDLSLFPVQLSLISRIKWIRRRLLARQ